MSSAETNGATIDCEDRNKFMEAFAGVYEHSRWIAEMAFERLNGCEALTLDALTGAMEDIVEQSTAEQQLALLRAHPDLAGRLAMSGELTQASQREQSSAGLDQCTQPEFEKFTALNEDYNARFGFPFIVAVSGMNRQQILSAFEVRVRNSPSAEFETALQQVHRIARLRLEKIFNEQSK